MNDSWSPAVVTKTFKDGPNLNATEINNSTIIEDSTTYAQRVAHTTSIKLVNNRYEIPVTQKFSLKAFNNTINIAQNYVCIFAPSSYATPLRQ